MLLSWVADVAGGKLASSQPFGLSHAAPLLHHCFGSVFLLPPFTFLSFSLLLSSFYYYLSAPSPPPLLPFLLSLLTFSLCDGVLLHPLPSSWDVW